MNKFGLTRCGYISNIFKMRVLILITLGLSFCVMLFGDVENKDTVGINTKEVQPQVVDLDNDHRDDVTGRIIPKFIGKSTSKRGATSIGSTSRGATSRGATSKSNLSHKYTSKSQDTDVFVDRGDGFNELLDENKRAKLFNFLSRNMGVNNKSQAVDIDSNKISSKKPIVVSLPSTKTVQKNITSKKKGMSKKTK